MVTDKLILKNPFNELSIFRQLSNNLLCFEEASIPIVSYAGLSIDLQVT